MRLNCGPTWSEKVAAKEAWHKWFAWHPVRVGGRDCRWLEFVERKGTLFAWPGDSRWVWKYRPLGEEE